MNEKHAYKIDSGQKSTVHGMAVLLAVAVVFSVVPALRFNLLASPPAWVWVVLLVGLLQAAYVAWMAIAPDWSTTRVVMIVFAVVATLYATAATAAMAWPVESPMPLDLGPIRNKVPLWCGSVLLIMALGMYAAGRVSWRWRRTRRTVGMSN